MYNGKRSLDGLLKGNESKKQKSSDISDAVTKAKERLLAKQSLKKSEPESQSFDKQRSLTQNLSLKERIEASKRKLAEKKQQQMMSEGKGGINVEIHPLLKNLSDNHINTTIRKNYNPLKQKVRDGFDLSSINPYVNQSDMSASIKLQHKPKPLVINPKGKYIAKGNELREKLKQEELERLKYEEIKSKGLVPDENIGEHLYKVQYPPSVEWWDKPYLKESKYGENNELVLDNEEAPVSFYIQHPVLVAPPWERHLGEQKSMYLTKKEMKRIRRNERQQKHKDKQDRIKLGLDPPPPPKVKLSNLMNVLTNEAIKDPTGVEMKVKEEVEQRYQKHMEANDSRKLTKDEKHEKIKSQHEKEISKGYFTTVYKINTLEDPQHFFKVDINAKQLNFVGILLINPKFNLIIVEGSSKSNQFYKKLLVNRINWQQQAKPKKNDENKVIDLRNNKCEILWEGQIRDFHFKKWSVMYTQNDDEAYMILQRFDCENYWREACMNNDT